MEMRQRRSTNGLLREASKDASGTRLVVVLINVDDADERGSGRGQRGVPGRHASGEASDTEKKTSRVSASSFRRPRRGATRNRRAHCAAPFGTLKRKCR